MNGYGPLHVECVVHDIVFGLNKLEICQQIGLKCLRLTYLVTRSQYLGTHVITIHENRPNQNQCCDSALVNLASIISISSPIYLIQCILGFDQGQL